MQKFAFSSTSIEAVPADQRNDILNHVTRMVSFWPWSDLQWSFSFSFSFSLSIFIFEFQFLNFNFWFSFLIFHLRFPAIMYCGWFFDFRIGRGIYRSFGPTDLGQERRVGKNSVNSSRWSVWRSNVDENDLDCYVDARATSTCTCT
jgi:hypothetical protein